MFVMKFNIPGLIFFVSFGELVQLGFTGLAIQSPSLN